MFLGLLLLLLNLGLAAFVAWRVTGWFSNLPDRLLAGLLLMPLQIIAGGLATGYAGVLGIGAITIFHVTLATLAWSQCPPVKPICLPSLDNSAKLILTSILVVVSTCLITAAFGQILIHDALTYRLSRVAHWLQEGSILQFPTNELRQSYHPINVDLVMAWLIAPFKLGYLPAQLAQTGGGLLLLTAIAVLAGELGLKRNGVLLALIAGFAMPSFCVQWHSAQSDLLTAGLLWAGITLLFRSPGDLPHMAIGWSGIAAAVGGKGTVLYLAFGLVVLTLCWWRSLAERKIPWRLHLLSALPAFLLLASPRYIENQIHFGNPFAPESAFEMNHGDAEKTDLLAKTGLNLASYAVQSLEPAANPPLLRELARPLWRVALASLPGDDPYDNRIYPRREYLEAFGPIERPGADTVSTGWFIPLLALAGAGSLIGAGRDPVWWRRLGLALCGMIYLIVFSALFVWWPTSFRYFTLLVPILAIFTALLIERASPKLVPAVLGIALLTAADTWFRVKNAGRAQFQPDPAELLYLSDLEIQQTIVNDLIPAGGTIGVLLPWNSPLTGFYRQTNSVAVEIVRERDLLHLPDADYLRDQGWNALVTHPVPIPRPAPDMTYLAFNHRVTGEPQYLVHVPAAGTPPRPGRQPFDGSAR